MGQDFPEACFGVGVVAHWTELVCVPDEVDVVCGDHKSLWMGTLQLQELFVSLPSVSQEARIGIVRQRDLMMERRLATRSSCDVVLQVGTPTRRR